MLPQVGGDEAGGLGGGVAGAEGGAHGGVGVELRGALGSVAQQGREALGHKLGRAVVQQHLGHYLAAGDDVG